MRRHGRPAPQRPAHAPGAGDPWAQMSDVAIIGIVGAGPMGVGIAHVSAVAGYDVRVHDIDAAKLALVPARLQDSLDRQVRRGALSNGDALAALARLRAAPTLSALGPCDLVIESVNEDEEVKRALYASLKGVLQAAAILATDTSSISVTRLATATDRPQRFVGMHFMYPVPRMELVEVIPGVATLPEVTRTVLDVAKRMGKTPVVAQDFPAFMVNRILAPMINEAIYVLYEGIGTVESIDTACRLKLHHPMGPLALADFISLDIFLSIMRALHDGLADQKYRPCPLLIKYVAAGWLGRKSGRGFYDYSVSPPKPTR